jgi:catechol 2,3-dioxygenase-like lactoylglutathione lyase family enzyme
MGLQHVYARPLGPLVSSQVAERRKGRQDDQMTMDLFAGIPVRDYNAAAVRYERLLGARPSFLPNDTEAVWELADHRYVFIKARPAHAGHAMHTFFVGDFDARISQIAERGLEPAQRETYANGVPKATFRDPDGNEIGLGGAEV